MIGLAFYISCDFPEAITGYNSLSFNHEYASSLNSLDDSKYPVGFGVLVKTVKIGNGLNDFTKAANIIFSFDMINKLSWIKAHVGDKDVKIGTNIGINANAYRVCWSLSPCRIVSIIKRKMNKSGTALISQIAYSTLDTHLLAGVERFRVMYSPISEEVIFEVR